jgi:hypothetical protein
LVRAVEISEDKLGINHPSTQAIRENLQILRQQLAPPQQQLEQQQLINWWQRLRENLDHGGGEALAGEDRD